MHLTFGVESVISPRFTDICPVLAANWESEPARKYGWTSKDKQQGSPNVKLCKAAFMWLSLQNTFSNSIWKMFFFTEHSLIDSWHLKLTFLVPGLTCNIQEKLTFVLRNEYLMYTQIIRISIFQIVFPVDQCCVQGCLGYMKVWPILTRKSLCAGMPVLHESLTHIDQKVSVWH